MDAARIDSAHIVGLSMGGFNALHFGLAHPGRACSLTIAGAGYGAMAADRPAFQQVSRAAADQFEQLGSAAYGRSEEHTSELQSLMRISYAVFCLKKKTTNH